MSDYKVALEITAAGNVEERLSSIASKLLGIHAKTKEIEKSLGNWGKLIGGAALAMAGFETLKFVDNIAKAGGDLQRQANIFHSAGNSLTDTANAIRGAFAAIQKVPGVDAVDAMKRYREIAGATQDNTGSLGVLPDFLKAQVVYGATTGADPEEGMKRLAKMIELRQGAIDHLTHKIDPQKFATELDVATKALQVGQGLITANDLQMLVKQAGPMAKGMDPMRFWSIYLASLEDMGGARTGTAMTAVARQVLGGIMTPRVADEWQRVGMLNAPGQGWHRHKGHVVIDDPEKAIKGYQTFRDDGFQKFIDDFVKPALNKSGYTTDQQLNAELYRFGSTETARRLYSMYLTGGEQVVAEQKKIRQALGLDSYDSIFKGGDYQQGIDSLTASIKSLEEALGGPAGKAVGEMASKLAEQINKVAAFAQAHPQIVEIGTYALTAASGLAIMAGSILAVTAALRIGGWIAGGSAAAAATGGSAAQGAAAVAGGSLLGGVAKKLGWLGAVIGLTEWLDPNGNFGGLTTPIDNWFKTHFGFDPSNVNVPMPDDGSARPQGLDYRTIAAKDYGDRQSVFHGDLEAVREASRAKALSSFAASAQPEIKAAVEGGTNSGVVAGLKGASGTARGIVQSWFSGISISVVPPAVSPNGGTRTADVYMDHQKVGKIVERGIAMNNRSVNTAAGFDGRSDWAPPDVAFA